MVYSGNTTNLLQHLRIWHPDKSQTSSSVSAGSTQLTLEQVSLNLVKKLSPSSGRAKAITPKVAEFVTSDLCPISLVEGKGF